MSEEQSAVAEVGNDSSGDSGQSSYVSDAWSQYTNGHESELNPDAAPKAQTPKEEVKPVEKPQAELPKPDDKAAKTEPEKQEPQKSRFEQTFIGEDGSFDFDKFSALKLPDMPEAPALEIGTPEPVIKQEQWEADRKEIQTLEENLTRELLGPLDSAYDLITKGSDPVDALKQVYNDRKQFIDNHLNEVRSQKEYQRHEAMEKRLNEGTINEKIRAQGTVNVNEIMSALPGETQAEKAELFHDILYGKETGAKVLDFYFQEKYPNQDKMSPAERANAAQKFIDELQSNKAKLRFMFDQALAIQTKKHLPAIRQTERLQALAQQKANALAAQRKPMGATKTAPAAGKNDGWGQYLSSHETADRV